MTPCGLTIRSSGQPPGYRCLPLSSTVRCQENARSCAHRVFAHRPPVPQSNARPLNLHGRSLERIQFNSRLGWAVRPLAADEPLVKHSKLLAIVLLGCPSSGGPLTCSAHGRNTTTPHAHARSARMLRCTNAPERQGISSIERLRTAQNLSHTAHSTKNARFPAMPSRLSQRTAPNPSIKRTCLRQAAYVKRWASVH